jgi:hypothetical protein
MGRAVRDDLPKVGVSRLRALGAIKLGDKTTVISFTEGDAVHRKEVGVTHRIFPNGGSWSFFLCPTCGRRVRTLRLYDGRVVCGRCDGLTDRSSGSDFHRPGDPYGRIARLQKLLYGGEVRLKKPGIWRRKQLEISLRRALISERRKQLSQWTKRSSRRAAPSST